MFGAIGALVVCVLNAGSPDAGPLINGFPLGIRLPLPSLGLPFCLPLPSPYFRYEQWLAFNLPRLG
jgi:hypothetical protein